MTKTDILEKSFNFSIKVIKLYNRLQVKKEFVISKQLLRSATSTGSNVHEASAAFSKKDFAHKMSIASEEARETQYWLKILDQGELVDFNLKDYIEEIKSIINITTAIAKTTQKSLKME